MLPTDLSLKLKRGHGMLRQGIVETLLSDIFTGQLQAGGQLVTQDLAERFGVSHTPIREALVALAAIGVIDLIPNRTAIVRGVTAKEVREVLQVRRALECEAVRLACGRVDLDELHDLTVQLRPLSEADLAQSAKLVEQARALDSRLHDLIANSCGNRFLANELNRLKILFRAFRDASWSEHGARNDFRRISDEAVEHLTIVGALRAANRVAAARAMARHLRGGFKNWTNVLPDSVEGTLKRDRLTSKGARRSRRDGTSP